MAHLSDLWSYSMWNYSVAVPLFSVVIALISEFSSVFATVEDSEVVLVYLLPYFP